MSHRFLLTALAFPLFAAAPEFKAHDIAEVKQAAQILAVDMNHDGKIDLVVLPQSGDLVWFENPGWERHVIVSNIHSMIDLAAWDIDGDGIPEIVLAYEFSSRTKTSAGIVSLLKHNGDPRQPWTMMEIDRLPGTHRLHLADIDGSGTKVLVSSPVAAADTEPPDFRGNVPLNYYRAGEWKRHLIDDSNQGVVHAITPVDWDHSGRDSILIAGFTGVRLYKLDKDGHWSYAVLTKGDPAPWPKGGASEVAVGHLGTERILATIEPWHGNEVAVYRQRNAEWQREVIDDSLVYGHALLANDFGGDGRDQIVAGCRDRAECLYIYNYDGKQWNRRSLDTNMGADGCVMVDINGDGKQDIACVGTITNNVKWYENVSAKK
jgi:hypothetical protein